VTSAHQNRLSRARFRVANSKDIFQSELKNSRSERISNLAKRVSPERQKCTRAGRTLRRNAARPEAVRHIESFNP